MLIEAGASADPRHAGNVAALRDVQPEDLLSGDIDANLDAPWLPPAVIREIMADLLQVAPGMITVAHLPRDAVWSVEGALATLGMDAKRGQSAYWPVHEGTARCRAGNRQSGETRRRMPELAPHTGRGRRRVGDRGDAASIDITMQRALAAIVVR